MLVHHAYWGRPKQRHYPHLSTLQDVVRYRIGGEEADLAEWRDVESCLRTRQQYSQSTWKLWGSGVAGSQALTGIPAVAGLRDDSELRAVSRVWPFELLIPECPPVSRRSSTPARWPGSLPLLRHLKPPVTRVLVRLLVRQLPPGVAESDVELVRLLARWLQVSLRG